MNATESFFFHPARTHVLGGWGGGIVLERLRFCLEVGVVRACLSVVDVVIDRHQSEIERCRDVCI